MPDSLTTFMKGQQQDAHGDEEPSRPPRLRRKNSIFGGLSVPHIGKSTESPRGMGALRAAKDKSPSPTRDESSPGKLRRLVSMSTMGNFFVKNQKTETTDFYSPSHVRVMPKPKWEHFSEGMQPNPDGQLVTCVSEQKEESYAATAGVLLHQTGRSEFTVRIVRSKDNHGGSMLVGVIGDDDQFPASGAWGRAWGLAPWNGMLFSFPDARQREKSRKNEIRGSALMRGDLRGKASGTTLQIRVDMDERRLYFKVNTTDWQLAMDDAGEPISLPSQVRPFVRTSYSGDSFGLVGLTHTASPPARRAAAAKPADVAAAGEELDSLNELQSFPANTRRPPPVEPAAAPDPGLLSQIKELRLELDMMRLKLHAEKELRRKAEDARIIAERRVEELMRSMRAKQARETEAELMGLTAGPPQRVSVDRIKEIEAELLREAVLANQVDSAQRQTHWNLALGGANAELAQQAENRWRSAAIRAQINVRSSYAQAAFN